MSRERRVLVTGGCGYIGSHVVRHLSEAGYSVVVLDNLSTGYAENLVHGEELLVGDLADPRVLKGAFRGRDFHAVFHFAASIVVPESVSDPLTYYENNTVNSLRLIRACVDHRVDAFLFSSTAAVYGEHARPPLLETSATEPANPYGRSKLVDEWILRDVGAVSPLRYMILRYFNVAGADPTQRMGQRTPNATHLIKVACEVAVGKRERLRIFGDDYHTRDGTCVRDYIHVEDLAAAHVAALRYLAAGKPSLALNCGYGRGFSVKEVVAAVERAIGSSLAVEIAPRRAGDVAELVADSSMIRRTLAWHPVFDDLDAIVATALAWERRLATGAVSAA